jgi:hypothetical protein
MWGKVSSLLKSLSAGLFITSCWKGSLSQLAKTVGPSYYCLYSLFNKIKDKGKIVSAGSRGARRGGGEGRGKGEEMNKRKNKASQAKKKKKGSHLVHIMICPGWYLLNHSSWCWVLSCQCIRLPLNHPSFQFSKFHWRKSLLYSAQEYIWDYLRPST